MSEPFEGLPHFEHRVATPRPASAVILWREGYAGREVFWVRRGAGLRFAGGFYAFPGGKVDRADGAIAVDGAEGEAAAFIVSAARELFEEAGVLLARGTFFSSANLRDDARRALLEGKLSFGQLLAQHGLRLSAEDFTPAGRWITPPSAPVRFDARFFLARVPLGQEAVVWPGELSDGGWIRCEDALRAWREGRALLHPPNRWAIQCVASAAPPECLEALRSPPHCVDHVTARVDFQEHLYGVPLRTATLPPATHTNAYLVGDRAMALVDPGSDEPDELARLFALLDGFAREERHVAQIWLTHHHGDHVAGLRAAWERLGHVPVVAHPSTADRVDVPCVPAIEGTALLGGWRALHTPGHARGHLCFYAESTGALLCGDMVSAVSTIVIDPPEGEMPVYLNELRRLRALAPRTLYPAHGAPIPDAVGKLEEYLAHRAQREARIVDALDSAGTLMEITARAYDDTPSFMHGVAARSCLATLLKLEGEGRALCEAERWRLAGHRIPTV